MPANKYEEEEIAMTRSKDKDMKKKYTVGEAIDQLSFGWFQLRLILIVGLVFIADTMEIMILSILAPVLQCQWGIKPWQQALMSATVFLGMYYISVC